MPKPGGVFYSSPKKGFLRLLQPMHSREGFTHHRYSCGEKKNWPAWMSSSFHLLSESALGEEFFSALEKGSHTQGKIDRTNIKIPKPPRLKSSKSAIKLRSYEKTPPSLPNDVQSRCIEERMLPTLSNPVLFRSEGPQVLHTHTYEHTHTIHIRTHTHHAHTHMR